MSIRSGVVLFSFLSAVGALAGNGDIGSSGASKIDPNSVTPASISKHRVQPDVTRDPSFKDESGRTYYKDKSGIPYYWDAEVEYPQYRDTDGKFYSYGIMPGSFDYLCKKSESIIGGTPFYKIFLSVNSKLKYSYGMYYQRVDRVIALYIGANCPKTRDQADWASYIKNENTACRSACERNAPAFHADDLFFRESKTKRQASECMEICDSYMGGQQEALASESSAQSDK